jgi:hypothetical protein
MRFRLRIKKTAFILYLYTQNFKFYVVTITRDEKMQEIMLAIGFVNFVLCKHLVCGTSAGGTASKCKLCRLAGSQSYGHEHEEEEEEDEPAPDPVLFFPGGDADCGSAATGSYRNMMYGNHLRLYNLILQLSRF